MNGWMDGLLEGWVEEKDRLLPATRPHLATGELRLVAVYGRHPTTIYYNPISMTTPPFTLYRIVFFIK